MTYNKTINIPIYISNDIVETIITTASEGGIHYWCDVVEEGEDSLSDGGTIKFDVEGTFHHITIKKFMSGLQIYGERFANDLSIHRTKDGLSLTIDPGMIDAEGADMIIQYALWGEIRYS
tara:strand:+ start:1123 stop:1482 length:360 start_codon:yes stop_codon:yes gene_type:complete